MKGTEARALAPPLTAHRFPSPGVPNPQELFLTARYALGSAERVDLLSQEDMGNVSRWVGSP